jgi:hypothetical protein
MRVTTNGAVLCVEAIGDPTDPVVLLIMGAGRARLEIPGARLLLVDGLGHEFPRWAWDHVLPALVAVTGERAALALDDDG